MTAERLVNAEAEPDSWLMYSGWTQRTWRPATLVVSILKLAQLGRAGTTPLVVDGVMYITEPPSSVIALDAGTGRFYWRYDHPLPDELNYCCGQANRGVAIQGDRLFMSTLDAHVVALDARTGNVMWDVAAGDPKQGYSKKAAPLVVGDKIITGIAGGEFGIRGFLDAYDVGTGDLDWRFDTIPGPDHPDSRTWEGDSWRTGGAPTWITGSYDPELNLVYWGTGNPGPDYNGEVRIGDNLYSDSVLALDADTGEMKWYFQFTPHDVHDWDATQIPVLVDAEFDGRQRKLMLWPNRNAFFYGLCLADELLARRSLEGLGNGWAGAPEQRGKEFGEVDEPLSCGADDAGEDLLGLRAAGRPITAADFAVDDGGANGVLGTPVGGLHLGRPQEGEHGGELAVEMGGEALGGRQGGRRVEESPEAREQAPAGHGEAVLGDRVRLPSITEREGVGEDRLHASRPRTARMIRGEGMRSAHQVRQTRLMQRRGEAAIRRPPVSHQDAVKVGAQHLGRLVEATPVANAIHRGLRRRKRPQPVPHRADPPAGLVGAHDGTAADLCAQRGVGRGGHAGRAMQHLHEPPGRHRQPEALPQECGHLGEGHADLLVQARNQGDGARPQVDVGGPHRVRGLQRMAALHAAPALGALPDGHIKAPDNRPDDGEIFLVLRRHALQCHRPAAPRTRRRERGLVGRINPGGNRATRPASIPTAGPPPRPPAPALGPIFGERCGLTEPRAPRGTE